METSLTSPSDRDPAKIYKPIQGHRKLTENEVKNAVEELNDNNYVKKFLKVERRYADPAEPMQRIGLISWVAAKGATPNKNGIYGFAKLRGNYPTDREASEKAELLIRNVDSYHKIYHAYVGRPFPLSERENLAHEVSEIDIRKDMTESVSNSIKNKKKSEQQQIREIEKREEELKEDTNKDEMDSSDYYTTLRVKLAQISWTYIETQKKLQEMKDIIIKTREEISKMEGEDDSYKTNYFDTYCKAREASGLDNATNKENFMKFLVEDADLGF